MRLTVTINGSTWLRVPCSALHPAAHDNTPAHMLYTRHMALISSMPGLGIAQHLNSLVLECTHRPC